MTEILSTLTVALTAIAGSSIILNFIMYKKQSKRLKEAEVGQTEANAITTLNDVMTQLTTRISKNNLDLDSKTQQIRSLTQKLWEAEQLNNRLNEKIISLTERLGVVTAKMNHFRHWHCKRCDCRDPRGREPQQDPPEAEYVPFREEDYSAHDEWEAKAGAEIISKAVNLHKEAQC